MNWREMFAVSLNELCPFVAWLKCKLFSGAVIVIVCSTIIVFCKENQSMIVRLIDPALSLVSIAILLGLSYPYSELSPTWLNLNLNKNLFLKSVKEAASILLQTIPDTIDIEDFQKQILQKFPEIQSIHDLHIWQLTQQKFVSTAHIIFLNPSIYKTIISEVLAFFHEQGINIVTIQPEFKSLSLKESPEEETKMLIERTVKNLCLVACRTDCEEKLCCQPKGSDVSDESIDAPCKSDVQLEQVISVRNVSAEELNTLSNYTSAKSLNYVESEASSQVELSDQKRSSASLYNPSNVRHKYKLQKTMSTIDRHHSQLPNTSKSTSEDIHLMSVKKFVSESVIKSSEHDDLGRQNSDILVENRMLKQLDTTDNNEMEDLYEKCDKET